MALFGKNTGKKLQKAYESKRREAMEAQRRGDIQGQAALHGEAEALLARIQAMNAAGS